MPITQSYDTALVLASLAVALIAAFTTLQLITSARALPFRLQKQRVAKAAFVLGAGIWAMHFTAMLALNLGVLVTYDPLLTMVSAIIAVLATEAALILLIFYPSLPQKIWIAGLIEGLGISGMHYVGMTAMSENCLPSHSVGGVILSVIICVILSSFALHIAVAGKMTVFNVRFLTRHLKTGSFNDNAVCSSICLAAAIAAMHYIAMSFTTLWENAAAVALAPTIDAYYLSLLITLTVFLICSLFLMLIISDRPAAITLTAGPGIAFPAPTPEPMPDQRPTENSAFSGDVTRIPYDAARGQRLTLPNAIRSVRADGHYTHLLMGDREFLCPWSISRLERALRDHGFVRTHRSYLVNTKFIRGFEQDKNKAVCVLGELENERIPVSRTYIPKIREITGLSKE